MSRECLRNVIFSDNDCHLKRLSLKVGLSETYRDLQTKMALDRVIQRHLPLVWLVGDAGVGRVDAEGGGEGGEVVLFLHEDLAD